MSKPTKYILTILISSMMCIAPGIFLAISPAFAQETITVRSGDHPTYSRIVFDWERSVNYSAELIADNLEITFEANAVPDFTSVVMDGPSFLTSPTYNTEGGKLKVTFRVNNGGRVRHFRSGTKIVVDLMVEGAPLTVPPAATGEIVEMVADEPVADEPLITQSDETPQTAVTPAVETAPLIIGNRELVIQASATNSAVTIDYMWDDDVKAAAFIRADNLWVVFNKYTAADHNRLNSVPGERVSFAGQIDDPDATILTYKVPLDHYAQMVKTQAGWRMILWSQFQVAEVPIEIGHQSVSSVGENIFLVASELGNIVKIDDPYIGDELTIVTANQSSQGVIKQNSYTEFNILKSAQGIALQLIADDIFATRHDSGISVTGQNGLAVSRSTLPALSQALPVTKDGGEPDGLEAELKLLDFAKWQEGPLADESYLKNRHELLYRLSTALESDRDEGRWNLAVYNIAHNNAAEAFGILQIMGESEPGFIENPSYRAALAVANIKMRRFDEAIDLLSHSSLVAEQDALLWRSLAYEAKGQYQKAMDDFNLGLDILLLQTDNNKTEFMFSAIRAANMLGDIEFMNNQINSMRRAQLNAKQLTELDFWHGQMAEKYGDDELAAAEYEKVIATGVRYPASLAKMARVNQQYRMEEIEAMQAVDELEKLRFAWRGDDFELDLLKQLGELYVDHNEYREGLSTLRQAATYFPRSSKTSGLTKQMSDIYNNLFLNGGADNMAPLRAMALFLEFRELTPLGADGDTMSRNLASRMVAVDLLNDAADLLEYQVQNRLQGVAQAEIASDLAMIYLLNKEPDKALNILRATRQSQLPEDIEAERRMIEIRSLVELGDYLEAEVMLEGMEGDVAESLRSDIFWKTEDWSRVVNNGYQRLGDRWADSNELNIDERQVVLRIAVALALDEDPNGLENLRSQYLIHMENGMFADAFEVITAREQTSGSDIRELTQTIASVDQLETFMNSYRSEFSVPNNLN